MYIEIEFYGGCIIDDAVMMLLEYKEKGILAYGIFNGHKLYSDKVSIDSAYIEITGRTRKEIRG